MRWLPHLCRFGVHVSRTLRKAGVYGYWECRTCGKRGYYRTNPYGYSALDETWLNGGPWDAPLPRAIDSEGKPLRSGSCAPKLERKSVPPMNRKKLYVGTATVTSYEPNGRMVIDVMSILFLGVSQGEADGHAYAQTQKLIEQTSKLGRSGPTSKFEMNPAGVEFEDGLFEAIMERKRANG